MKNLFAKELNLIRVKNLTDHFTHDLKIQLLAAVVVSTSLCQVSLASECQDNASLNGPKVTEVSAKIKAAMDAQRIADKIPGITYSVYNDRCLILADQVGQSDLEGTEKLDANATLFRLASISKLFTSIAISQLIEKGVLNRENRLMDLDKVNFVRYLKTHETPERLAKWSKIKLHHLLSHQSGISKDIPGTRLFYNTDDVKDHKFPSMDSLYKGLTSVEFIYEPGIVPPGMKYSNLGMNLLARVVEAYNCEGYTFQKYVMEKIMRPLAMKDTYYDVTVKQQALLVTGYGDFIAEKGRTKVPKVYKVGAYDGSIGVASTATDLAKLGQELLRLVQGQGSRLLTNKQVVTDFFTLKSGFSNSMAWASGPLWQTLPGESTANAIWVGHTGTGISERTTVVVAPEKNLGVVILFNAHDANREKYVKIISDVLQTQNGNMSEQAKALVANSKEFLKVYQPLKVADPAPSDKAALEKYVGVYFTDIVGPQALTLAPEGYLIFSGNKLIAEDVRAGKFRMPQTAGILFNAEPVQYIFDQNGQVTGVLAANVKMFSKIK